jgi:16S rRNA C967 or C1407 C5-methylase (RsmB/RsmF family)
MVRKKKISIIIERDLWERFKTKVENEKGLKELSKAVEEVIEEKICEDLIIEALEEFLSSEKPPLVITPVKPKIQTDTGKSVRELRDLRFKIYEKRGNKYFNKKS